MNSRERVLAVLDRKPADRIPFDLGGTDCSSIHALPYQALRKHFGLPDGPIKCGCLIQLIAELDGSVMDLMGVDTEILPFGSRETKIWNTPFGIDLVVPARFNVELLPDGSNVVRNAKGVIHAERAAKAYYFDPVGVPLAPVESPGELSRFDDLFERWDYSAVFDEPVEVMAARARRQHAATSRAVIAPWRMHYLQSGQIMRGYEQFLVDLMVEKDLAHAILRKLHEVYLRRVDTFLDAFGDAIDVVFLTDDLGTQDSGLISPALYKEMIYPYASELVGKIRAAGKPVVMHSCGAIAPFIPFLIEMGVNAVNPVQVAATGMNPADLVRQFGKDIAFWGGGCDTQHALNASNPDIVTADVERRMREFGNASLVFTQVHNIQYDVSVANILAMKDAYVKHSR